MMQDGYPFIFQMNDYSGADALLEYTMSIIHFSAFCLMY